MRFKTQRIYRTFSPVILAICCSCPCKAQLGLAAGWEYGTAMFANSPFFIRRPSSGIYTELCYAPPESRIFPSFSYMLKTIPVPVRNTFFNNPDDFAKFQHYILKLNYRMSEEQHYHLLFLGIGVASILPETVLSDQQGNAIALIDTANTHLYALVQAGVQYMRRILPNPAFMQVSRPIYSIYTCTPKTDTICCKVVPS